MIGSDGSFWKSLTDIWSLVSGACFSGGNNSKSQDGTGGFVSWLAEEPFIGSCLQCRFAMCSAQSFTVHFIVNRSTPVSFDVDEHATRSRVCANKMALSSRRGLIITWGTTCPYALQL